ncbi:hypothetical protein BAUCODRAFT_148948 [Baudoinia panamericana UAMH 10762]|uniref:Uncharacterized protein n=1 Tax=Baudoinia panamericana (strain UAMH 10762) TaxID=717646 RepID=M2NB82_BAUPA|nr:uncharacterized protein BAUCODRAFT_148948 [Baudoinia panamericana UAMH 10762]EMC96120.1 hypothetical protein BAUCODRAFT_148948 [Baudoinia panamericana UAMH 10762]
MTCFAFSTWPRDMLRWVQSIRNSKNPGPNLATFSRFLYLGDFSTSMPVGTIAELHAMQQRGTLSPIIVDSRQVNWHLRAALGKQLKDFDRHVVEHEVHSGHRWDTVARKR